jgi:hypothetical protein
MHKSCHFYLARIWFVINTVIALSPPLYWSADAYKSLYILGMPATLFYFLVISISITGSILYAYWDDLARGEFAS